MKRTSPTSARRRSLRAITRSGTTTTLSLQRGGLSKRAMAPMSVRPRERNRSGIACECITYLFVNEHVDPRARHARTNDVEGTWRCGYLMYEA